MIPKADERADEPALAIESTFRGHYSELVALARLLVDDRGEAEEIVQGAFVRTFAARRRLRKAAREPLPYLRRAVVNLSRGRLRKRRTLRGSPSDPIEHARSAEDNVLGTERRTEVLAALQRLPGRQRECIVLRYLLDSSTEQTADVLGISSGSVKTHLHRGLSNLEVQLKDKR